MYTGTTPHRPARFTLIEMITAIVILAILSSLAVPRFAAVDAEARRASAKALAKNIQLSAAHVNTLYREQHNAADAVSVTGVGEPVKVAFGYPDNGEIQKLFPNLDGIDEVEGTFRVLGALDPANCSVRYEAPTAAGTLPTITLVTAGCG